MKSFFFGNINISKVKILSSDKKFLLNANIHSCKRLSFWSVIQCRVSFSHYSPCSIAVVLLVSHFCDKELWFIIQCTQAHFLYASLLCYLYRCYFAHAFRANQINVEKKCNSRFDNLPMVEMACCFQLHTPVSMATIAL